MTRVLIIGGTGMLGHKLVQVLGKRFDTWTTIRGPYESVERFGIFDRDRTIANIDVEDLSGLAKAIEQVKPDVVINAVGVIKQVDDSKNIETLSTINSVLPHKLAELGKANGFRLICMSTDCVFSGDTGNYIEDDIADATDAYGRSKLLGEVTVGNCLTVRTSIIGRELATGHSLVEWFLSNRHGSVDGYVNAIYTGFPTVTLAAIISGLITDHPELDGLYHVSSEPISKFELLRLISEHYRADIEIRANEKFVIDRSLDSSRFREATGFRSATWPEMIAEMAADTTAYDTWH